MQLNKNILLLQNQYFHNQTTDKKITVTLGNGWLNKN